MLWSVVFDFGKYGDNFLKMWKTKKSVSDLLLLYYWFFSNLVYGLIAKLGFSINSNAA